MKGMKGWVSRESPFRHGAAAMSLGFELPVGKSGLGSPDEYRSRATLESDTEV